MKEFELALGDGAFLHVYDSAEPGRLPVVWHHGTPNIGAPPRPLFEAADRLGLRWVAYDRPGYGGSTPAPGRDIASAARYTERVADRLGLDRFVVMGHSGGGPHALACAALLPDRVIAVVSGAGLAPYAAEGFDWYAGMAASCVASHHASLQGRAAKERHEATAAFDPEMFSPSDHAAFEGEWSWFESVVGPAMEGGPGGLVDDDLAYVAPWGFDPAEVTAPILILHGEDDRMVPVTHGRWLAAHCPTAELRTFPGEGHISVLRSGESALEWISRRTPGAAPG